MKDILELQSKHEPMNNSFIGNMVVRGYISEDSAELIL